ncbi:hypothetical protein DOTSEDRAFT_121211 [Lecanosticta acicola]|uniref:6-phosphogluconate dehydrogenase C-terminal domain-like protein n=1 Tax=Lecanosticta acicola TaxID=111012 RepID=A0AAI9ECR3_9PEZI|nr:hypothetical protein DOTSEDRAFT_121211 [Lecanosticta acicola]
MALATLGILSIGDMGLGVARLLLNNNFRVISNASDRGQATQDRAKKNDVDLVSTDVELCNNADYILSIVPPRDAIATAQRIATAASSIGSKARANPLYFLDLNAISPRAAREIDDILSQRSSNVRFIDGGIIGGPPKKKDDGNWYRPSIPTSGPHRLSEAQPHGGKLAETLNIKHVNDDIGSASGLKMCFASMSKGFTAIAISSFTTAHNLGVLGHLRAEMDEHAPGNRARAEKSLTAMPPKAYRWVNEMEYIAETFEADGGFSKDESPFRDFARIYDLVANGTELGNEVTEGRKRGTNADDVAKLVAEGTERRKLKED